MPRDQRQPLPPTQIGRALRELGIVWIAAHYPQAKGRIERSFQTAQDRLVKGLRVAGVKTLEQANRYLEREFLAWWNQHLKVMPAHASDAHRPLDPEQDLTAALSQVETRQVHNDYTIQLDGQWYQIQRGSICAGLRGATVRVERRLDGSLAVRFRQRYVAVAACAARPQPIAQPQSKPARGRASKSRPSESVRAALRQLFKKSGPPLWLAGHLDRTRTADTLD